MLRHVAINASSDPKVPLLTSVKNSHDMKPSLLIGLAFGAMAAVPLLAPSPAQALASCALSSSLGNGGSCTIVDGTDTYEISIVNDSFLNAFPTLSDQTTKMFWWGNESKAISAARAVGTAFGGPPFAQYFAFNFTTDSVVRAIRFRADIVPANALAYDNNVSNPYFYAKSTLVTPAGPSAAVPGPLPVLGAAASFCFSRKLRKRIKPSANSADGTLGA